MAGSPLTAPRVIGAVAAVVLQIVLAPNIAILGAVPNLVLAYVALLAVISPANPALLVAFIGGLVYDLVGSGPVGACAFLLVILAYAAPAAFKVLDNDTLFMAIVVMVAAIFVVEIAYALFVLAFGLSASLIDALFLRAIPCAVYDCIIALIAYPFAVRLRDKSNDDVSGMPVIR